ncbi:hypothetical protein EVAR_17490_1 [Eumeta japonica]|uniref:Uncharacterized protein n=1 Tax=Eumeta variegata TaxID=151549 RepID=A0A4C1ZLC6_EUMVA|nr:hypothetical protein EVAR_17490_1 [Eumeta japonica]
MAPPDSPECLETLNLIENSPEPESPQSDHRPETPQSDQTKIKLDLHSAISQAEIRNLQRLEQMNVAQQIIISQPSTSQMAQPILHHNTDEVLFTPLLRETQSSQFFFYFKLRGLDLRPFTFAQCELGAANDRRHQCGDNVLDGELNAHFEAWRVWLNTT